METILLNNELHMPLLGLGVFQVTDVEVCEKTVLHALKTGYRMKILPPAMGTRKQLVMRFRKVRLLERIFFFLPKFGFKMQDMKRQKYLSKKHSLIWEQTISTCI